MPKKPFTPKLLKILVEMNGGSVELCEDRGLLSVIHFPDGKRWTFLGGITGINNSAAFEICRNKGFTVDILKGAGFSVPEGKTFYSDALAQEIETPLNGNEAVKWAHQLGYPIFAKPDNLGQGILVCKVNSDSELRVISNLIFEKTNAIRIERAHVGKDYRVIVYKDKVYMAYERIPLSVFGNGQSCVDELIRAKLERLRLRGEIPLGVELSDIAIDKALREQRLHRDYIPELGQKVRLLDNASHNKGSDTRDCSAEIHPGFVDIAVRAAEAIGLDFCGVDILSPDITAAPSRENYVILELNSFPTLVLYYALGPEQKARVESLYSDILDDLHAKAR